MGGSVAEFYMLVLYTNRRQFESQLGFQSFGRLPVNGDLIHTFGKTATMTLSRVSGKATILRSILANILPLTQHQRYLYHCIMFNNNKACCQKSLSI
jgi:hypothetical protein